MNDMDALQYAVILAIVAAAAVYLAYRSVRLLRSARATSCAGGCGGCPQAKSTIDANPGRPLVQLEAPACESPRR